MEYFLRHRLIALTLLVQLIALPILLVLTREPQSSQGKAAPTTTISLTPNTTITSPQNLLKGEYFSTDVIIDPGPNAITAVKIEIFYDPTKVELVKTLPISLNTDIFPKEIAEPIFGEGKIDFTLSTSNSARFVTQRTKIATVYFKAIDAAQRSYIYFGENTKLFGIANPNANILESKIPEILQISTPSAGQTGSFSNLRTK